MKTKRDTDKEITDSHNTISTIAHSIAITSQKKILEGLRILGSSPDDEEIVPRDFHKRAIQSENRYTRE